MSLPDKKIRVSIKFTPLRFSFHVINHRVNAVCSISNISVDNYMFYCRLSGLSPFAGDTEAETLSNITMAQYDFDAPEFDDISDTAKDFIDKLLVQQPKSDSISPEEFLPHCCALIRVSYTCQFATL